MPLNFTEESKPNSNSLGGNCFYNVGTISKATDTTNTPENKFEKDIAIQLEISIDGLEYPKTVTVAGDWKRDALGVITGWGGAFKVQKLLQACGVEGQTEDRENKQAGIKADSISSLVGKECAHLSFKKMDGKYKVWDQFFSVETTPQVIKNAFIKDQIRITAGGYNTNKPWKWDNGEQANPSPVATMNGAAAEGIPDFLR